MTSLSPNANEAAGITVNAVQQADCDDLWRWRNDPHSRAQSLNTDSVPFEQHCKWFVSALGNTDQFLLLGRMPNNSELGTTEKIGMVRFDIEPVNDSSGNTQKPYIDKKAIVSINLNPDFRGKGFSVPLLSKAVEAFKSSIALRSSTLRHVRFIEATIKEDNKASIKCFQGAGFSLANTNNLQDPESKTMGQKRFHLILD